MHCIVCFEKYTVDTIVSLHCGHDICNVCVKGMSECPVCKKNIQVIPTPLSVANMINDGYIRCSNFQCTTICTHDTINIHMDKCPFAPTICKYCKETYPNNSEHFVNCDHIGTLCQYCNLSMQIRELKDHITICDNVPIECDYCKINFERAVLNSHKLECVCRPVDCDYCKITTEFQNIKQHTKNCSRRTIKCKYAHYGCYMQDIQHTINEHEKTCQYTKYKILDNLQDDGEHIELNVRGMKLTTCINTINKSKLLSAIHKLHKQKTIYIDYDYSKFVNVLNYMSGMHHIICDNDDMQYFDVDYVDYIDPNKIIKVTLLPSSNVIFTKFSNITTIKHIHDNFICSDNAYYLQISDDILYHLVDIITHNTLSYNSRCEQCKIDAPNNNSNYLYLHGYANALDTYIEFCNMRVLRQRQNMFGFHVEPVCEFMCKLLRTIDEQQNNTCVLFNITFANNIFHIRGNNKYVYESLHTDRSLYDNPINKQMQNILHQFIQQLNTFSEQQSSHINTTGYNYIRENTRRITDCDYVDIINKYTNTHIDNIKESIIQCFEEIFEDMHTRINKIMLEAIELDAELKHFITYSMDLCNPPK
jgi:hypothetical protein